MGELGAMFNPGMRHEIEERQARAARREEEGDADPGDLRIDLYSGVAVIALGKNGPSLVEPESASPVAADAEADADEQDDRSPSDSSKDVAHD